MTKNLFGGLFRLPVMLAGGWILYSNFFIDHEVDLPNALLAERKTFHSEALDQQISYYSDRQAAGAPLALIHSVNAAASAYEMGPLFRHYRSQRPVYALDLPGYGFSERRPGKYRPQDFAAVIGEFLQQVIGEPADVVALSLGCEFAARAALAWPERIRSLALISPSGFSRRSESTRSQKAGESGASRILYPLLSFPLWSQALFDLIATRRSINYYLKRSFAGPVTPGFADYGYASSHQPGARHVPLNFLSGRLFTPNALGDLYEKVETPTLVIYDQDQFVRFDELPGLLERKANWRSARIAPTMGLPHFEKLAETAAALDSFWAATN